MNQAVQQEQSKGVAIDRIFQRLAATYGAAWDRSLGQVPMADIKTVWNHELAGYLQRRQSMLSIAWALENLPERPPNAIQFKNLCRCAPCADTPALAAPAADPERMARELERIQPMMAERIQTDGKEWARRLQRAHEQGLVLNLNQVRCYREALGIALQ